jgi:8-oxo-dGTP pyrophosphatase MutT (NUDIX family)
MARRKDEKEALRRERERREAEARAAQQRKRMVGYGAGGVLAIAAIALVVLLAAGGGDSEGQGGGDVFPEGGDVPEQAQFDLETAAREARCELGDTRGSARDHTTSLDEKVQYEDNPPTQGRHYQVPAEDGLYYEAPADEALVHTLEHGRVIVWVKPSLPLEVRETVRALFEEDEYQMVVVPRRNMEPAVAATAWNRDPEPNGTGRTLACDEWSDGVVDAIRTFRDEHRSNGPEPVP